MNTTAARLLDGKAAAKAIREDVAEGCRRLLESRGLVPGLTVVLVGDDPASALYVRNKEKAAREAGMASRILRLPAEAGEAAILDVVRGLNRDAAVHGILVQLPLPRDVRESHVIEAIAADKDVDGFHPVNAGRLLIGLPGFVPCTPAGIVELLKRNGIPLAGRHAVIVGRSNIVGKPMAVLLLRENCTVTVCHSHTRDLASVTSQADILVAAMGRTAAIRGAHIRDGAVVVDVGMNAVTDEAECRELFGDDEKRLREIRERGSTLVGDVHPREAAGRAGWLSPVPGVVGPLTIAMLLKNTLDAASREAAREDF
jgi:methylenetetrahydrofolate dehydrogenase (NADP+)/methenyltetrahydrofolate cyclohydrolase